MRKPDKLARLISAALREERAREFKKPIKRRSKQAAEGVFMAKAITNSKDRIFRLAMRAITATDVYERHSAYKDLEDAVRACHELMSKKMKRDLRRNAP